MNLWGCNLRVYKRIRSDVPHVVFLGLLVPHWPKHYLCLYCKEYHVELFSYLCSLYSWNISHIYFSTQWAAVNMYSGLIITPPQKWCSNGIIWRETWNNIFRVAISHVITRSIFRLNWIKGVNSSRLNSSYAYF